MSLIIKGMCLPKHAAFNGEKDTIYQCAVVVHKDNTAELVVRREPASPFANCNEAHIDKYPLIEVPTPHGGLIDEETKVESYIETWTCTCSDFGTQRVMAVDDLRYLPEIIEAEVE